MEKLFLMKKETVYLVFLPSICFQHVREYNKGNERENPVFNDFYFLYGLHQTAGGATGGNQESRSFWKGSLSGFFLHKRFIAGAAKTYQNKTALMQFLPS